MHLIIDERIQQATKKDFTDTGITVTRKYILPQDRPYIGCFAGMQSIYQEGKDKNTSGKTA